MDRNDLISNNVAQMCFWTKNYEKLNVRLSDRKEKHTFPFFRGSGENSKSRQNPLSAAKQAKVQVPGSL